MIQYVPVNYSSDANGLISISLCTGLQTLHCHILDNCHIYLQPTLRYVTIYIDITMVRHTVDYWIMHFFI